eukprot:12299086-Alexandrium_andersonii.AAC.1
MDGLRTTMLEDGLAALCHSVLGPPVRVSHQDLHWVREVLQGEFDARVRRGRFDEFSLEAGIVLAAA